MQLTKIIYLFLRRLLSKDLIRLIITLSTLTFLVISIIFNAENIFNQILSTSLFGFILVAILITFLSIFVNALAWRSLLDWLGYGCHNINILNLFLSSNLYKYIPGGFIHFVERIRVLNSQLEINKSLVAVSLEPVLMLVSAMLWVPLGNSNILFKIFCILPSMLFFRRFLNLFLPYLNNITSSKLKKTVLSKSLDYSINRLSIFNTSYPIKTLCIEMFFLLLRFLGFWFCLKAFSIQSSLFFQDWLSSFCLAWAIGLIVPGAPGGIGIFESFMLFLVGDSVSRPALLSVLICYRAISMISDLLAYLFSKLNNLINTPFKIKI